MQDPTPLDYLKHDDPYTFDIKLDVAIKGNKYEKSLYVQWYI